ncbi:MAG: APC family permease [Chitinophagaceae bacterium]
MKIAKLNLFDFTMIVVSLVIGMGIFRTPINVANNAYSPWMFFSVWLLGGLVALCGALTYAEIGSRLPVTGGYYKIFSYAYHPSIAFAINCVILVSNAASLAGVAIIGGEYITGILIPASKDPQWIKDVANAASVQTLQIVIAISCIIIFYGINLLGLKMSARTQNVLMVIKISLVVLLITPLFFSDYAPSLPATGTATNPVFLEYLKAFGIGLVGVSFTYGGYQQTINFGAEVNDAKRTIPRGIFFGIFIIILLYLSINYAYIKVIGFEQLKTSKNIAAIMAGKVFGEYGERIASVVLFLSVMAYVNILLMSNPRVMAAMSEDKILPTNFRKRHFRTNVLTTSLSVFAGLCALIVFWAKEFDTILSFSIFLDCFGMILSAGSIFILRKKTAELNGTGIYIMKWYPLIPLFFILVYSFVAVILFITQRDLALIGLGVMAAFLGLYFLVEYFQKNKTNGKRESTTN